MRVDIKVLTKQCTYCMLIYKWRQRGQEVVFSWPVSSPFVIFHADLWITDHFINTNGNIALMNIMYDITQFVIIVPVPDKIEVNFVGYFIQHVLLNIWNVLSCYFRSC